MDLFQFWDKPAPPAEICDLLDTWQNDKDFNYILYNDQTAADFIKKYLDLQVWKAYNKCAVPAMKADLFRYCVLYVKGGIYVDADTQNSGKLYNFLKNDKIGTLMTRQTRVANDFLFVRNPQSLLFEKTINTAVSNIENEISDNVWEVTGPGIMTKLYHDKKTIPLFNDFRIEPAQIIREIVLFKHDLNYKKSDTDWRHQIGSGASSIFQSEN